MLDEVALAVERLPKDARMMLTDEGPKAVASEDGLRLERGRLTSLIVEAVAQGNEVVEIPVTVIAPTVTTDDARRALEASRLAFAAPVTLGYQGTTFTLTPQQLLAVAEVNPHGVASGLPLSFDTEAAEKLLGPYLATVVQSPVDAQITPDPDGRGIAVVPSSDGTVVEWEALTGALARAALSTERRYVPIPTTPAYPNLTTEEAEEFGIRQEIASFTTYFSPANQARVNNITQVARALDGVIVRPGETFSFNETVGPRTKAAGYDEAPVIRDGVLTPGVGGGICQVSTTLFNAAFFAGLPVVERHPHSFYIDHYPVGRDATVSYGSADLKFRNDSDQMLLIIVTATDRAVTASLAAPRWNRVVEYTTTPFHDLLPPHSSAQKPRKLRDPALASGEESMEEGVDGRSVEVVRRVLTHDGAPVREDTFSSRYSPKDYIIRVGG
jgi:vancomycin resistance protein YoaR